MGRRANTAGVQGAALEPAPSLRALDLHLAAVEHDLASAVLLRYDDLVQSRSFWSGRFEPFPHQIRNLITFARRAPVALIADDVGLGKTISAGLVLSELIARRRVHRTLVVAPSLLLEQWREELREKFGLDAVTARGAELGNVLGGGDAIVITTYETVTRYADDLRTGGFDMLILDEAHRLTSLYGRPGGPTQAAARIYDALSAHVFTYVLMLTATPIQRSAWDLYSLVDALAVARYQPNPFGSPEAFEEAFLVHEPGASRGARHRLDPAQRDAFRAGLSDYLIRTSRRLADVPLPGRSVHLVRVAAGQAEIEMTRTLTRLAEPLGASATVRLAAAMMSSPAAFAQQLANMQATSASPTVADAVEAARATADRRPAGAKWKRLLALVRNLQTRDGASARVVVFTTRRATQEALAKGLRAAGIPTGVLRGGDANANASTVAAFQADPPGVQVIVSTDAGAHGLNLQGSNEIVNYDLPWNPMRIEQRIGRVQRLGATSETVHVRNLVIEGGIEDRIVLRLLRKLQSVTSAVGDVEAILTAAAGGADDEHSFERDLSTLVFDTLLDQDVEARLDAIERNLDAARGAFDEGTGLVEDVLGETLEDGVDEIGVPVLEPVEPRIPVPTFVARALREDGCRVTRVEDGRLRVTPPHDPPFVATFDPDDGLLRGEGAEEDGRSNVVALHEGSRGFERLVGARTERSMHALRVLRIDAARREERLTAWFRDAGSDAEVTAVRVIERSDGFYGQLHLRATASVAHDRMERLVEARIGGRRPKTPKDAPTLDERYDVTTAFNVHEERLWQAVHDHPDIQAFTRFYEARAERERERLGRDGVADAAAENFEPRLTARVQAARGTLIERCLVSTSFLVAGGGPYDVTFTMLGPDVVEAPETEACAASGQWVPSQILGTCDVTGRRAIRHLLVTSDHSGRVGLPEAAVTCSVTGATVLSDEVGVSDVSGRVAIAPLVQVCPVTGQRLLEEEFATCTFSNTLVSPAALRVSDVSGRLGRADRVVTSAVSGVRGDESEFERCHATGAFALPRELAASDASGARVLPHVLVPADKPPDAQALERELVTCEVSGARVLPGHVASSAVTGKRVDRDLLVPSDRSGALALPDEMVRCEVTGARLLPDEVGRCADTGRWVDRTQLARNDFTGTWMTNERLRTCPETGKRGRESDLVQCEATEAWVDPNVTTRCTASNTLVVSRLTIDCAECGRPLLRDLAVRTFDERWAHEAHVDTCSWTGRVRLASEVTSCRLTTRRIGVDEVDASGAARIFRTLQSEVVASSAIDASATELARQAFQGHGIRVHRAWMRRGEAPNVAAVIVQQRRLFGLYRRHYVAFIDCVHERVVANVGEVSVR